MLRRDDDAPFCLVLSGGGAKGVYHIGVWQALKELEVPICACIGNSIGALIAGAIAMEDPSLMDASAGFFSPECAFDLPDELKKDGEIGIANHSLRSYRHILSALRQHNGLDTGPLRDLVYRHLSEQRLRASSIDLGVVVFNLSDRRTEELFLEDMPEGTVCDYLLASAAFPGFRMQKIAGSTYIDGGVADNIPYAMAKRRGYRNLIVVDISGAGIRRRFDMQNTRTVYIRNSIQMGGLLDFHEKTLRDFQLLGYLDTLRVFGEVSGYRYFIKAPEQEIDDAGSIPEQKLRELSLEWGLEDVRCLEDILPEYCRYDRRTPLVLAECAAEILGLERVRLWSQEALMSSLEESMREQKEQASEILCVNQDRGPYALRHRIDSFLSLGFERESFAQTPYIAYILVAGLFNGLQKKLLLARLRRSYPQLPAGCLLLDELTRH